MFCIVSLGFNSTNVVTQKQYVDTSRIVKDTSFLEEELNDSVLLLALNHYDVKHPVKVLAQAKLESGNFQSSLYKKKNNFLGLYDSKRKRYFKFNHWTDCILAYKSMVEYRKRDGENHYKFLKRIKYANDPRYIERLKEIEKSLL